MPKMLPNGPIPKRGQNPTSLSSQFINKLTQVGDAFLIDRSEYSDYEAERTKLYRYARSRYKRISLKQVPQGLRVTLVNFIDKDPQDAEQVSTPSSYPGGGSSDRSNQVPDSSQGAGVARQAS